MELVAKKGECPSCGASVCMEIALRSEFVECRFCQTKICLKKDEAPPPSSQAQQWQKPTTISGAVIDAIGKVSGAFQEAAAAKASPEQQELERLKREVEALKKKKKAQKAKGCGCGCLVLFILFVIFCVIVDMYGEEIVESIESAIIEEMYTEATNVPEKDYRWRE